MVPTIHFHKTVTSTNTIASELAKNGAAHGEIVVAEKQLQGRGRLGKSWSSPPGKGVYCSIILRPERLKQEDYAKITLVAGLAVAKVIENYGNIECYLKWPNDVYVKGKKCCGILAESSFSENPADRFVILGIGINVLTELDEFPDELRLTATSLYLETGKYISLDILIKKLHSEILHQIKRLEYSGFAEILKEWRERDFLRGRKLAWVTNTGDVIHGISEGPDESGRLLVRDEKGVRHEVISGDVQLAQKKKPQDHQS